MDWTAKWIWVDSLLDTPNCYIYVRKEIELTNTPSALIHVTCSSEYKLYINGRYIGRGPSPCHPAWQYYDTFDVSHALRPGKNVIAALCYNYGVGTHFRPQAPGGFLLQLDIQHNGDEKYTIGTDETWMVRSGSGWDFNSRRMFWTIGFQEVYDSRHKPVGWNVVGFDESEWEAPHVIGEVGCEPWIRLIPRQIPPLREWDILPDEILKTGTITPVADPDLDIATRIYNEQTTTVPEIIKYVRNIAIPGGDAAIVNPGPDTFITLDFGREVVGYPFIRIRSGGKATIDIGYSETLDEKGDVYPTRQGILQADRLILHGGRQEWQAFGRRAFRYMQLTFRSITAPISIESIAVTRIGYPVEAVSGFECSDPLLNEIWRTGVYTLSVCMQDAYEDCPLREHGQYPGDARVQALMNYYSFFDSALAAKALEQFVQNQREDGLFNALWPSSTNHILPDYNLVWVMMLHDYFLHTADHGPVNLLYQNMSLLLDNWFTTQESENGLLTWNPKPDVPGHEWWLFIDHAPLDKRGEVAAYNAFYYQALRDASKLAGSLSHADDAVRWHSRSERVFSAFNERFWSEDRGIYMDCNVSGEQSETISVQTNTLAVLFGLADAEKSARIKNFFTSDQPRVESSGPYFNFYVLQAMAKLDMEQEALDLIRSDWGEMLRRGATTWWETFSRSWPEDMICPDSLCHAWSGAPTYFLSAEILGVRPSIPGSNVVIIQPRVGDLAWAKGHIKTPSGFVDVEWQSNEEGFNIDIDAPNGFIAALPVGRFSNPQIDEIDLSPETPERRARRTYGWGNMVWRDSEEHDPYVDWLLSQESKPPEHYHPRRHLTRDGNYIWVRETPITHARYEVRESRRD